METQSQHAPPSPGSASEVERLRLLVTLQNQIVEVARRNEETRRACARLSRGLAEESAGRSALTRWNPWRWVDGARLAEWLRRLRPSAPAGSDLHNKRVQAPVNGSSRNEH